ncbi:peptidoglycan-binding protein [Planotetraspora phitsanulokensis]|uniref:Peptidoglycan-binding protein n=1 Tax=Planotetraspora phitsanulokensis TaxID=575192 RepID=A0A8J3U8N3_9ACTN|nr:peptidoglycan-binding protein [Planotetraspora phitsanulokensis]GII39102.1 peptidoglycan-binding protein [Planotetraspora phitsanulokensis]
MAESDDEPRRGRKRVLLGAVALLAIVAAGGAAVVVIGHGGEPEKTGAAKAPVATASVVKTDLSDTRTLPGTLGFGAERSVRGAGTGLVTRLPKAGVTVVRGKPLYWVDDHPVPAFVGDTPLFRKLDKVGTRGRDVTVVANNLRALGYAIGYLPPQTPVTGKPSVPGDVFTASLKSALKQWQVAAGLQPTGTLDVGQVVVLSGPSRVASVKAQLGDPVAEELITVTPTAKVVTVPVDATDVGTIRPKARVSIVLPSGKKIVGQVTAIGRTVQDVTDGSGQNTAQLNITVTPRKAADVKALDAAGVEVTFTSQVRRGVLAVPVGALLALREGGYALQLPDGKLVAAETGMFVRGMVEVTGKGVTEGLEVVTSS